jgi:glycosyltransferase involved in cell wall biosynthesis
MASGKPAAAPIRVLHLRDSPWVDGPGRTILDSGSHFDRARIEYHIGAFVSDTSGSHPMLKAARERGISVHEILDRGDLKSTVKRVEDLVDSLHIDILHTSDMRTRICGWLCRRHRPKLRLITTTHGWIANTPRRLVMRFLDKVLLRRFDAVVMVSHAMRKLVPEWWLPSKRVLIAHNALVLGVYGNEHVTQPRPRRDLSKGAVLLNVGRLSPEKGQDLLLKAFAEASKTYPNLRLQFAGIGPLEQPLRDLAAALGVADRVEFLGYIADMPALYRDVDLVVQSSLTEGLPNVILETAYLRVPTLATEVGGTGEVIEHDRSGWLIRPGSVDELTQGILQFMKNPDRFAEMGEAAHERIKAHFSFTVRTERQTRLYEELVGRARGAET